VRFARRSAPPEGLPDASPTVLYVGRLEPRKGVGVLIHAMEAVRRRLPNAALVIVGDGPERRALEELAAAQATPIRFVGRVNNDELPPYFHASDVVCSPALGGESFGIVLLEALAAGKPVVASRIEGYATVVSDGPCVRLVTPGDADDLAAGIVDLVARAISPEDAAAVARPYDWALIAERLVSVYRRVQRTFIARPR
jgi:phosphatidylinositol alpha-mannosyltransferase